MPFFAQRGVKWKHFMWYRKETVVLVMFLAFFATVQDYKHVWVRTAQLHQVAQRTHDASNETQRCALEDDNAHSGVHYFWQKVTSQVVLQIAYKYLSRKE